MGKKVQSSSGHEKKPSKSFKNSGILEFSDTKVESTEIKRSFKPPPPNKKSNKKSTDRSKE